MALGCTVISALNNRKFAVKTCITQGLFAKAALAIFFLTASAESAAAVTCNDPTSTDLTSPYLYVDGNTNVDISVTETACTDSGTPEGTKINIESSGSIIVNDKPALVLYDGSVVSIDNAAIIESSVVFSGVILTNGSGGHESINYSIVNRTGASIKGTGADARGIHNTDATLSSLDNQGTIEALKGIGVFNSSSGVILVLDNDALGTIQGGIYGIANFGGIDSLVNDGRVESDQQAALLNTNRINNLTNNGTIQSLTSEVAIENSGPITEFTNSGTIEGGINNGSTIGTLTNSGSIKKSGNGGELGDHAIYSTGTITNGIINTGTLDGHVTLGTATLNLNGTSSRVTGAVSGSSDSRVNVNGTFTSENTFDVGHFEVASGATFNMAHNVTTTSQATFQNDGVLSIAATDAVTIQNGPYTQSASGVLRINVTDDTTYGKLIVSGEANLPSDAKIDVNVTDPNFDFTVSRMEGVLTATTLNSDGTFDVTDNSVLFDFSAEKDNNAIDLLLSAALADSCTSPVADSRSGPCGIGSGFTLDAIDVVNTGTIQGGDVGVGMYDGATTVTNAGTVSGTNQGIAIAEGATVGGIVNSGTITGNKVIQVGAGATITSSITNNVDSQLSGGSGAILNVSASITEIVNRGIISSDSDAAVLNQIGEDQSAEPAQIGTLTNFSTGTISGVTHGVANMGSEIFTLTNAGTIEATSTQNAGFDAGILNLVGGIGELNNQEGGLISGATGVYNYEATIETFTNAGTIKATGTDGYAIQNLGTITNGITNTGTLDGKVALGAATLNLNGTSSRVTGAVTGGTGSRVNVNGAFTTESTFNVDKMALAIGATLTNNHTITTTDTSGLSITGTGVSIINNGVIEGDRGIDALGISAPIGYSLVNNADSRLSGDSGAIRNVKAIVSEITNRGTISSTAASYAVINQSQSSVTTFTNAGEVSTARGAAVQNTGDSQIQTMTNLSSGTILGVDQAVLNIRSLIETLNNTGTISATATQDPDGEGYSVAGIVNLGVIATLNNQESGLIDSVLRGVYNDNTGTITTFSNAGTIRATGSDGYAIQNLGTITNGITNTGTLDGKVELGTATLNLNGTSSRVTGAVSGSSDSRVNVNGTFTSENTFEVGHFEVASGATFNMAHNVTTTSQATFQNDGVLSIAATDAVTIQTGPYTQGASGVLRINVTDDTTYGKLIVAGDAILEGTAKIDVNVTDPGFDFTVSRMESVLTATTLNSDGTFDVTDNSVLFDFSAEQVADAIDLLLSSVLEDGCTSLVTDSQTGPCGIGSGFALNAIEVVGTGAIQGGGVGVGMYDGATTVTNSGTIAGTNQGIAIAEGATVGGIVNSGMITGTEAIQVGTGAKLTNGITNTGTLDGKVELGTATLNLNGTSSRVTGAVTGGTNSRVNVNGTFTSENTFDVGHFEVASGATFNMAHNVTTTSQATFQNDGVLSIAATDVVTIQNGPYTQGATGVLRINVTDDTTYGKLIVAGEAILEGTAKIDVNVTDPDFDFEVSRMEGVLTATTLNSNGTFDVTDNSVLFDFSAEKVANAIDLLLRSALADSCTSPVADSRSGPCGIGSGFTLDAIDVVNTGTIQGGDVGVGMYDGATTVTNAGTISGTNQGIAIAEGATVGGIVNSGMITGTEAIQVGAGAKLNNGITNTGTLDGKVELGTATLNLNGTSSRVTGAVTGGANSSVNVNGTFTTENTFNVGAMTVASGGLLTMGHNITAGTFTNQGTLAVGTGTRTLTGNYTQASGGVFRTTVASDTEYGKLVVSGTATLAGKAEVTVASAATALTQGAVLEGVITADKVEGEFAEVTTTSSIYTFNGLYSDTSFDLQVVAPEPGVIEGNVQRYGSPAALGAAMTLDTLASDPGAMAPVLDTLDGLSEQAQSDAVEQTLPVLVAGGSMAGSQSQTAFNRVLQSRQAVVDGMSSGEEFAGTRDVWGKAFGSWANQGDLNNVSGYSVDSGGLAFGLDRHISPKANLGLALAYAYSSVNSNSTVAPSSLTVNSYQLGIYGDYQIRPTWQLNYQIDGAINTNSSSRDLSRFAGTPGVGASAKGSYNSYVGHVGLGLKKFLNLGSNTRLTPELRLDYMTVQSDGYTESGGGLLDLRVSSQSYNTLYTGFDLRVDHELSNGVNLMANIGAAYNALDNSVQMTSAYQGGGASFVTDGLSVSPWIYKAGVGVSGMVSKNLELNLRYDIDFSSTSYTNQMVSARVKVLF